MKCAPGTSTAGGHFSDYPYQGWILTVWAPGLKAGFWADLGSGSQGTSKPVSVWGRYFQLCWISKSLEADSPTSHSQLVSSCLCEHHPLPAPAGFQLSYGTTNLRMKTMVWLITLERLPTTPSAVIMGSVLQGKHHRERNFPSHQHQISLFTREAFWWQGIF